MSEQAIVGWVRGRTNGYWAIALSFIKRMTVIMLKLNGKLGELKVSATSNIELWRTEGRDQYPVLRA